jgi:hypothetical protein
MALDKKYRLIWATPEGRTVQQLDEIAFLNYTKIVNGIDTCNIGLPWKKYGNIFRPDYQLQVYRSPTIGGKRRLEGIFFMRQAITRTRVEDNVTILDMSGFGPKEFLKRRVIKYKSGTSEASKTDFIDDMMKEIVDENMGAAAESDDADRAVAYTNGNFQIQADASAGASETRSFAYRNVMTELRALHQLSRTNNPLIYFDIVPVTPSLFEFRTYVGQRGGDKRFTAGKSAFYFSTERGNLEGPQYEINYNGEKNVVYVGGGGEGEEREVVEREATGRSELSIWARNEKFRDDRQEGETAGLQATGDEELGKFRTEQTFVANFLDAPGSRYGIEWDFGNLHTAFYAGQTFDVEIKVVYVTLQEDGSENIEGRNEITEFGA